jgi:1-acyl-sn-glycerol-3-phosphate acyltransferase
MDERSPSLAISLFRGARLALHLLYAALLAVFYPHLKSAKRRRILKNWSRQLLCILNIGIRTEGEMSVRRESGFLVVSNHVSWLDVFVLNTIYPSRFIAKAEVRN